MVLGWGRMALGKEIEAARRDIGAVKLWCFLWASEGMEKGSVLIDGAELGMMLKCSVSMGAIALGGSGLLSMALGARH